MERKNWKMWIVAVIAMMLVCFTAGAIAEEAVHELYMDVIEEEARYDGFYAVCTNPDDNPADIARINHNRGEIEESFRIMKSEFEERTVYLHRDDRIHAHFLTCFISLMIYRIPRETAGEQIYLRRYHHDTEGDGCKETR